MYKCNQCKAIFDSPAEQKREVEYYPRPFGNGSEPYGGGYYECCPECGSEDFDRYEDDFEDLYYKSIEQRKELENKLAEKEKEIEELKIRRANSFNKYSNLVTEYDKLVDELEAKEEEIERIKQEKTYIMNFGDKVKEVTIPDYNQDKISFAVEQLEKVKEFVNDFYGEYSAGVITNFIDNQIEELKKEMK